MFRIIVRYGMNQSEKTSSEALTIGQLRRDPTLRAELGYGDSVKFKLNGIEMPDEAGMPNGATVEVVTAANSKAV